MALPDVKKKIMNYVAARDHSEDELRTKLAPHFAEAEIDDALTWARAQSWFASADVLSRQVAEQQHRRGYGTLKVNQTLSAKGLPPIIADFSDEKRRAQKLVLAKWRPDELHGLDPRAAQKLQAKISRFLNGRGFEPDVVNTVLESDLNLKGSFYDDQF